NMDTPADARTVQRLLAARLRPFMHAWVCRSDDHWRQLSTGSCRAPGPALVGSHREDLILVLCCWARALPDRIEHDAHPADRHWRNIAGDRISTLYCRHYPDLDQDSGARRCRVAYWHRTPRSRRGYGAWLLARAEQEQRHARLAP